MPPMARPHVTLCTVDPASPSQGEQAGWEGPDAHRGWKSGGREERTSVTGTKVSTDVISSCPHTDLWWG